MKCSNCKFDNEETLKVCAKCGYPMNLPEKWKLTYKSLLISFLVVLGVVTGLHILISILYL